MAKESCDSLDSRRIGRAPGADRLDRGWAGELGRTDGCRAGRVGIGPRGALGRRKRWATEDFGPQTDWAERAGPVRSGSNTRLGGMGRADWVGSPLLDWAGPTRLGGTSERRGDGAGRRGRRRQLGAGRESSLQKSRLVGEFLIFLNNLTAKVIDSAVGENTMIVVPGVRDVLASVSILVCGDSVESSCMYMSLEIGKYSNGAQADSMDYCRSRVEGLHGGIARCMVRRYRDRAIYGWGLPTQGCEFLEIERRSLGAAGEKGKATGERAREKSGGVSGERVSGGRPSRWVGDRGVSEMTKGLQ
ncbi:hypothetical protein CRG98_004864 [Punica granatum]|uniref:Uncharacterized protein n=1 Tax=Punica granatum TaxID=22663 RepID=A0A2I0L240_PUNGR|nr:hypothetical protein CRG98_004864 [Punica granatum]